MRISILEFPAQDSETGGRVKGEKVGWRLETGGWRKGERPSVTVGLERDRYRVAGVKKR
jgi:hypothetical protein